MFEMLYSNFCPWRASQHPTVYELLVISLTSAF